MQTHTTSEVNPTHLAKKLQILEDHLNQLEEQLVRAQRLAALGTMSTMICHEFNNLLTPVVSYSKYALEQDDPKLWHKALTRAHESGQKAADVAQLLLRFSKGSDSGETADIGQVVEDAVKSLVRDPEKDNIRLQVQVEPATAAICAQLLQQVLYNLIINARQAMLGRPGKLTITSHFKDRQIEISVADTGPGIDPHILPKIFDPFFTTKSKADRPDMEGTGLGLAISRNIIERAGGQLGVMSQLGKGTCFTLTLPMGQKDNTPTD